MKKSGLLGILIAFTMLFSACAPEREAYIPLTPEPEPTAAQSSAAPDAPGNLGLLASILSETLDRTISAGADANETATGQNAAKLVVNALGLASEALLNNMGQGSVDYMAVAIEKNIAPFSMLSVESMSEAQMREFAQAVAERVESGELSEPLRGSQTALDADLRALCSIAVIATNPLAAGRGDLYYGEGDSDKLSYWTLAAIGTIMTEMSLSDEMQAKLSAFASVNDQTNPTRGTTTADEYQYTTLMRELWGVSLNNSASGLSVSQSRLYLGHPTGDYVRQYPTAYRAEVSGDRVRVYANVLNASTSSQYAGKVAVTLRRVEDTLLGYQIVSVERLSYRMWKFASAEAPATASGSTVEALVDDDLSTVWKIGNASGVDANVTVKFNTPMILSGLAIYNGNHSGDQAALERDGYAGRIGIRFDGEETDTIRMDISSKIDPLYAGYPVVVPFEQEFSVETVTIVFYNDNVKNPIVISDIKGF